MPFHRVGFWNRVKRPCFVLAPLANVTDCAFRRVVAKHGRPDVIWTVDGLHHQRDRFMLDLKYDESERPIIAQLFGKHPELFYEATQLVKSLGFDGVDINMGCPERGVCHSGHGAALINEPKVAQQIVLACKKAGGDGFPVSVKTRIGYNHIETENWIPYILDVEPAALTLHLRTKKEMSKVPAHWDHSILDPIVQAINLRGNRTVFIGNGDVTDVEDGRKKVEEFGLDGVMIGRGTFGKPWLFTPENKPATFQDTVRIMIEHTNLWEELLSHEKRFYDMRKHYKAYVVGFHGAKQFRTRLLESETPDEARAIAQEVLDYLDSGKHLLLRDLDPDSL